MNPDKNQLFPVSANKWAHLLSVVAITVTDIKGNIDGKVYDPDFTYAHTLLLEGVEPTTEGSDPLAGMQSVVAYGVAPAELATFTALNMGELYVANYRNYSPAQNREALLHTEGGFRNLGRDFDAVKSRARRVHSNVLVHVLHGAERGWYAS